MQVAGTRTLPVVCCCWQSCGSTWTAIARAKARGFTCSGGGIVQQIHAVLAKLRERMSATESH